MNKPAKSYLVALFVAIDLRNTTRESYELFFFVQLSGQQLEQLLNSVP